MRELAVGIVFLMLALSACPAMAQEQSLESRVSKVERELNDNSGGIILFLCGAFCALWAQNTGRNSWLWFFLGLVCSGIAVLVVLWKNADDLAKQAASRLQ